MKYIYDGFIKQNIAPVGAKRLVIYNEDDVEVFSIALGTLAPPTENKLYSFGLISDSHLQPATGINEDMKLDNALTWFEEQGAEFVCHCGDITNHGFWNSDGTQDLTQFAEFQRICNLHPNLPVYAVCGNHDSYFQSITGTLTNLETYTGHGLYYSVTKDDDMFIILGQPTGATPMSTEAFQWLQNTLSSNSSKRFFIFVHAYLDSGNAHNSYGNNLFESWANTSEFKTLLSNYNTTLFHGHSHITFDHQKTDKTANYANNGFHSIHVPCVMGYREIIEGETPFESLGYLVDVHENFIILRARDFGKESSGAMIDPKWVPIATYKIET